MEEIIAVMRVADDGPDGVRRASKEERAALERVFTDQLGGDAQRHFPWAWKTSDLVAVRPVEITVDHTRRRQRLRIRDRISVRIRCRCEGDEAMSCVIPGHERAGEELVADELVVEDEKLSFEDRGVCATARRSIMPARTSNRPRRTRSGWRVQFLPGYAAGFVR